MIRDVTQLREHGQVERRVDELDVDVATWRAGMRAAARREGMRIRTFVVELADPDARPDPAAAPPAGTLVFAVRTDLPVDPDALAAAVNAMPAPPPEVLARLNQLSPPGSYRPGEQSSSELASVTSLTDQQARRSGHPCALRDDR